MIRAQFPNFKDEPGTSSVPAVGMSAWPRKRRLPEISTAWTSWKWRWPEAQFSSISLTPLSSSPPPPLPPLIMSHRACRHRHCIRPRSAHRRHRHSLRFRHSLIIQCFGSFLCAFFFLGRGSSPIQSKWIERNGANNRWKHQLVNQRKRLNWSIINCYGVSPSHRLHQHRLISRLDR